MMNHLHFLHGFMGQSTDWGPVLLHLRNFFSERNTPQFHMHNLWKDLEALPGPSLKNWGLRFTQKLPPSGNVLIGYSMGGRLAMHFPVWEQRKISGIILIAAHTGILQESEKEARLTSDQSWARKFLEEPWDAVTGEWNRQPVFAHDKMRPPRREQDFSKPLLASALTHWSLGKQDDMTQRLKEFQCPIHYIYGDRDEKFAGLAKSIQMRVPNLRVHGVPGGHSCHFQSPQQVASAISKLFTSPF